MQDMGAAGITCSSCEMSAAGDNVGMDIRLRPKVPTRQTEYASLRNFTLRVSREHAGCGAEREGASC